MGRIAFVLRCRKLRWKHLDFTCFGAAADALEIEDRGKALHAVKLKIMKLELV